MTDELMARLRVELSAAFGRGFNSGRDDADLNVAVKTEQPRHEAALKRVAGLDAVAPSADHWRLLAEAHQQDSAILDQLEADGLPIREAAHKLIAEAGRGLPAEPGTEREG